MSALFSLDLSAQKSENSIAADNSQSSNGYSEHELFNEEERRWLAEHPVIRVMNEPDYAPYDFTLNGKATGYSIEYMQLLADKLNIKIEYVQEDFSVLMEMAKDKKIDVMHSIFNTPKERHNFLNFTRPYKDSVNAIITRIGEEVPEGLIKLQGKRVAAVPNDAASELIRQRFSGITLVKVSNYEEALKSVAFNRADATILELPVANHLIGQLMLNNLSTASELDAGLGNDYQYRLAVRKDWPELVTLLEKAMASLSAEEIKKLDERWLNISIETSRSVKTEDVLFEMLSRPSNLIVFALLFLLIVAGILTSLKLFGRTKRNQMTFQFTSKSATWVAVIFNAVLILMVIILGWWALKNIESKVKLNVHQSLHTVMQTTLETMKTWINEQKRELRNIVENPKFAEMVSNQLELYQNEQNVGASDALIEMRSFIVGLQEKSSYLGFFVISPDGISIASMRDSNLSQINIIHNLRPDLLSRAFKGESVFVPPIESDVILPDVANIITRKKPPTMFLLEPIKDSNQNIIAVLAKRLDPQSNFSRISQLGQIGYSGETYFFNQQGQMLTETRFIDQLKSIGLVDSDGQSILSIAIKDPGYSLLNGVKKNDLKKSLPLTQMASSATQGNSDYNIDGYRDYRGVEVVGVWSWDVDLGVGITSEIDFSEAIAPYSTARNVVFITLFVTLLVSSLFTLLTLLLGRKANQALIAEQNLLEVRVEQRTFELKSSEERFELAMRGSNDGVWDWNYQTNDVYYSQRWMAMLGYQQDELSGDLNTWLELCHPEDAIETFKLIEACIRGEQDSFSLEFRMRHKKGHWVPILSRAYAVRNQQSGEVTRLVGTHLDLTQHKKLQHEITKAKELAESANKAKSDFLATMSHEIRTPMNGVIGMLGLLLKNDLDKSQRQRATIAQNSAQSLLSLINDILDFSKVEAGKLELEILDFDLRELLSDVVKTLSFKAAENNTELLLNVVAVKQSMVKGDPSRLRQILINLVSNAIKFTHQGEIVIEASLFDPKDHTGELQKNEENSLCFNCKVTDTGIGIAKEKLKNLFDSFTQVDTSTTREFGGSGLGLAICKNLCRLMQGQITVSSEEGQGSCFEFNVTLQRSHKSQLVLPRVDISQLKILVVDDNETNREIFKSQLESWGAKTILAEDAITALEYCEEHKENMFDVALLDMNMPKIDGITLAETIRKRSEFDSMKLLIMSSAPDVVPLDRLYKIGISACFSKPVADSELLDALSVVTIEEELKESFTTELMVTKNFLSTVSYSVNQSPIPLENNALNWPDKTRILIVDDNEVNLLVAQGILEEFGLDCDVARDGAEAVNKLKMVSSSASFSLVLMDCQMPRLDGYDATRQIRQGHAGSSYKNVPIVAMTAHAMQGARQKCLDSGMDDYIAKPVDGEQLLFLCQKWLPSNSATVSTTHSNIQNIETPNKLSAPQNKTLENTLNIPDGLQVYDFSKNTPAICAKPKLFLKVINAFANQYQTFQQSLTNAIEKKDKEQIKNLVHSVKGSGGNIGLQQIYDQAYDIEQNYSVAESFDSDALNALVQSVQNSIKDIEMLLSNNQDKAHIKTINTREFSEVSQTIYNLLVKSEYISQAMIDEFTMSASIADKVNECQKIIKALDAFEYDTALKYLAEIK